MLQINCLTLGDYQVNCYVVCENGSSSCVLIDPGYEQERIQQFLREQGLSVDAILLTHGHFDHVGAVEPLLEKLGCKLYMQQSDCAMKINPMISWMYPLVGCDYEQLQLCAEGDVIRAAGLSFAVLETPGHTKGSVCYRVEDAIFTGDTLFDGSCGRTDLPGGDGKTIAVSLQRLKGIFENLRVFPGHGTPTTLDEQRRYNPYLR